MYNKAYTYKSGAKTGTYWSDVKWTGSEYTLADDGDTSTTKNTTHHYICDVDCTKVRYYYYNNYYVLLEKGDINPLKTMINYKENENNPDENINVHDSAVKEIIDNWYVKNLSRIENYLDKETVYCNDRSTIVIEGWDKSSNITTNPISKPTTILAEPITSVQRENPFESPLSNNNINLIVNNYYCLFISTYVS